MLYFNLSNTRTNKSLQNWWWWWKFKKKSVKYIWI